MKPKYALRYLLALAGSSLLTISSAAATTLYWDGTDTTGNADGGVGNWDNTTTNWDTLNAAGTNIDWTAGDIASFGVVGAGYTATLTEDITVGGLIFNKVNGDNDVYTINSATNSRTLSFSSGDNFIRLNIGNGGAPTATITGQVAGTGANVIIAPQSTVASGGSTSFGTVIFNGTSTGGWTGTTTINTAGTLALAASNQALLNTSGITLNAGNILLTNIATGSENTINRVSDTAAITSSGSGSIAIANTSTNGRAYTETIGSITHSNGQLSLGFTTIQNGTAPSTQTLMVGGLTRSGTATIAINGGGSGAGSLHGNSFIRVNGITTSTAANEIIGPWMTAGSVLAAQSDWAIYQSDGVSGRVVSRGIASSAQTTWTSSLATGNYTAAMGNPTAVTTNNTLTADRSVNTLRATFAESNNTTSHTMTAATDTITFAGHALNNGDVVGFRGAGGLTDSRPYYVINSVAGTSFQLSLTPGGSLLDLTSDTEGFITTGLNLNGNTLGTSGFITGTTGAAAIGGGSASTISLPTTTSGNLYLHGAASIWIDSPIKDNGAGVLTLVKSGTTTVTLSGNNTFTGGLAVNAGTVRLVGDQTITGGVTLNGGVFGDITDGISAAEIDSNSVSVNGNASMFITGGETLASAIAINSTGNLKLAAGAAGSGGTISGVVSGNGILTHSNGSNGGNGNLTLSNTANTHTGVISIVTDNNQNFTLAVNSLADSATPGAGNIQMGGGGTLGGHTFALNTGAIAPLILNNRQVELIGDGGTSVLFKLSNNSSQAFTIHTDLLASGTNAKTLTLGGSGAGLSTFAGTITNGSHTTLNLAKLDAASTWYLTNTANTYNGTTTVSQGILGFANGALGSTGTINAVGGTLLWLSGNTQDISSRLVMAAGNTTLNTWGNNVTFASAIGSGTTGTLTKNGLGTLSLGGTNTYTGSTTLNAGTLKLDYATNATSKLSNTASTGTLLLNGGTLELSGGTHVETVLSTTLNTGGTFITQPTGGATLSMGAITFTGGAIDFAEGSIATTTTGVTNGILSQRATVAGANFAMKSGSDIVAYDYVGANGSNGYTGATMAANINYSLTANGVSTLAGTTGATTNTLKIANTATGSLAVAGNNLTVGAILFSGSADYDITTSGSGRVTPTILHNYGTGGAVLNLGALGGSLTQFGTGKTILNNAAHTNSTLTVNGGTVQISDNLQIGTNSGVVAITLNNGTLLASETLALAADGAGLRARTITLGAGGGTLVAASSKTLTVSGVISGALNPLTIGSASSTGTVNLSATNTYTGETNVTGGTLLVNGNISTSVLTTVQTGATLGGSGTVGSLTIDSGGFFSPGNSPGIETVNGNYIQNGTLQIEIEGDTAGNGTGFHDQVVVNGNVTLNGLLDLMTFSGTYAENDLLFILLNDGSDAITGTFTSLAQGANVGTYAGFNWNISYSGNQTSPGVGTFTGGNDIVLQATVIPEPKAALLGAIGLLLLLRRRR